MTEEIVINIDPLEITGQFPEVLNDEYSKIKMNFRTMLETTKYCGICLRSDLHLTYLHNETDPDKYPDRMEREMHDLLFNLIYKELPSAYICSSCNSQLGQVHRFIMKIKYTSKVLNSYLRQLYTQLDKMGKTLSEPKQNGYAVLTLANEISNITEKKIKIESKLKTSKKKLLQPQKMTKNRAKVKSVKSNLLKYSIVKDSSSKKSKYLCYHCKQIFKTRNGIKYHLKTLNMKQNRKLVRALQCSECKITPCEHEKYLKALQSQIKTGKVLLRCIDCGFVCNKKTSLIAHTNKAHLNKFPYLCATCGKSFHSQAAHYKHKWEFHKDLLLCKYCDKQFNKNDDILDKHIKECRKITRQYKCKECEASFDDTKHLVSHEKKHNLQAFPCDKCSKSFNTVYQFKRHQDFHSTTTVNRAPSKHDCSICQEKFSTIKEIKKHLKTNHRPDEKHVCNDCDKVFDTRNQYRQHIRTAGHKRKTQTTVNYSFACDVCTFTCKTRSRLEDHTNLRHLKIKPYSCAVCEKSFTSEKKLQHHSELHSNPSKFQCQHCTSTFTSILALKKHVSRFHTGEKPYKCDYCSKTFVCMGECNFHIKRKHSNTDLSCSLCDNTFDNVSSLHSHIKSNHCHTEALDVPKYDTITDGISELYKI